MAYWVNPFSASYWRSGVEHEHPEWLAPGAVNVRSGATAICPLSDYFDYAKAGFVELVTRFQRSSDLLGRRRLEYPALLGDRARASQPGRIGGQSLEAPRRVVRCGARGEAGVMIAIFSLPFDNHRLHAVDMEQVSDSYSFATGQSKQCIC